MRKFVLVVIFLTLLVNVGNLLWDTLESSAEKMSADKDRIVYYAEKKSQEDERWLINFEINQASKLYLNEKYLRVVKLADVDADSKEIVDRATKKPLSDVLVALDALNINSIIQIRDFVKTNLHEAGYEITSANLTDWSPVPRFIHKLKQPVLKRFALALNRIWLDLYKKFDLNKLETGCVSSHLPMRYPFVVPGGRFREVYYWDSYWTLEGLLVCGMFDTAKQMLQNFMYFIDQFGFIPNGSRIYYLNRSQVGPLSLFIQF
jgi:alpha,alpha-trehalase